MRLGWAPCAFKCGPDYIDPMFHRAVLGVESRSLDLFFSAPETVRTLYAKGAAGHGAAVCEGAMGFYDGLGGVSDRASAWHLAATLGLPVQLLWVALAVPVTALGASLYQTADLGIAPYDYLSLGLRDYTPVPYFGCRVFTDALCAVLAFLLGGLFGLGTLICAFGLGPFVQFFTRHFSEKVLRYKPEKK